MSAPYNWFKSFHIFFVIAWMVGIFYLPRIMVHYQEAKKEGEGVTRLAKMAKKLYAFSSVMMLFAVACGMILWLFFGMTGAWLHVKLVIVGIFVVHHHLCGYFVKQIENDTLRPSSVFFRWFNEYPTLLMLVIIVLTLFKPF